MKDSCGEVALCESFFSGTDTGIQRQFVYLYTILMPEEILLIPFLSGGGYNKGRKFKRRETIMRNFYHTIRKKRLSVIILYFAAFFISCLFLVTALEMRASASGVMLGSAILLWCIAVAFDAFCKAEERKEKRKKQHAVAIKKNTPTASQLAHMNDKYRGRRVAACRKR